MKKLDLTGWAALAEIVGAVAVVASLLFVADSINRNTAQLQASSDNFLIQLQDENFRDWALNPDLASIILRFSRNEELTEIEKFRYQSDVSRMLNRWEVAFVRYEQGFLDLEAWQVWDATFSHQIVGNMMLPRTWWAEWRLGFTPGFAAHVDAAFERASNP